MRVATMQQSEVGATRNGISALEQARGGVLRCQQDVQNTRTGLSSGYGGADGGAFGNLLDQWDQNADIILSNLDRMIDELNQTLSEHGMTQGSANDSISGELNKSGSVFDTLSP
ncbi:WXG100 family type VII secretion target [Streptomyces sp. NBC_01320]|uniref:WXG100 family type VII secretion target n=1 Tax=Streptomyces sp. NBC_01320 TaxID=2903824 RepID=UPI002E0D154F|nr:hypothetical protein OG395_56625 [Streptomyces sp. NBC_01320]